MSNGSRFADDFALTGRRIDTTSQSLRCRARAHRPGPSRRELQRPLDQPAPAFFVTGLGQYAIEAECCQPQSHLTARQALLDNRDAPSTSARERFEGCQLGLQQIRGAILYSGKRADLSALGTVATVAACVVVPAWCAGARGAAMQPTPAPARFWGAVAGFARSRPGSAHGRRLAGLGLLLEMARVVDRRSEVIRIREGRLWSGQRRQPQLMAALRGRPVARSG